MSGASADPATRVPVRDDLADLEPYGAPQLDVDVRLNTNETAEPPPGGYLEEVARRMQALELNRYPDRPHRRLRERLGERFGLPPGRVWAANGSNEVLAQLLQAYGGPGRSVLSFVPGYSMYPILSRVSMTERLAVDLDDDLELTPQVAAGAVAAHDPDLILFASPNNPTGIPVGADAVRALHDGSRALVVVDEAYVEFGGPSAVGLLDELDRLVVARTFSKAFRLAGLRLGYLLGPSWVVDDVRRVRLPYHLDAITQVAGEVALEQEAEFLEHRRRVAAERDRVAERLADLDGVTVWPSAANFLLFRTDRDDLFERLLDRGVLVRDFSDAPRLDGCLRVTIGTPRENDAFLAALRDELHDGG